MLILLNLTFCTYLYFRTGRSILQYAPSSSYKMFGFQLYTTQVRLFFAFRTCSKDRAWRVQNLVETINGLLVRREGRKEVSRSRLERVC